MVVTILFEPVSTMHTLLDGAAQVTKSCLPSAESARPSGEAGISTVFATLAEATSKTATWLAVA